MPNVNCALWNQQRACSQRSIIYSLLFKVSRDWILSHCATSKRQENALDRSAVLSSVPEDFSPWSHASRPYSQVAWHLDRWPWYFRLANRKTHTQWGVSVFTEMIFKPERRSSRSLIGAVLWLSLVFTDILNMVTKKILPPCGLNNA